MLYNYKSVKKKLSPAWRGLFAVLGYSGDYFKSYSLRQIYGTLIPRTFYSNYLKPFRLRKGYLITSQESVLLVY
jgi:hypothetical protein